jgi:hypothetical protein
VGASAHLARYEAATATSRRADATGAAELLLARSRHMVAASRWASLVEGLDTRLDLPRHSAALEADLRAHVEAQELLARVEAEGVRPEALLLVSEPTSPEPLSSPACMHAPSRAPSAEPPESPRALAAAPRPEAADRVKRPPNAFFLYTRDMRPRLIRELGRRQAHLVSVAAGKRWQAERPEVRVRYAALAREAKRAHAEAHPDNVLQAGKRRRT